MKRNTVIKTAAVLGVVSLSLAACGGGSSSTETEAAAPATSAAATSAATEAAASDCKVTTLTMGSLLPQTGQLAFLGGPMMGGVAYAVEQINAAGGVNGSPVTLINVDEGDSSTDVASQSVDSLIAKGVTGFVGAASTGNTLNILDKATSNGLVEVSPSNTGPVLSTVDDKGLYFRTAPSDALQGLVLADKASQDGKTNVAVIARKEPYGEGLAKAFIDNFTAAGGTIAGGDAIYYDPAATSFEAEVGKIKAAKPDALVVISYDEGAKIMQEAIKQGVGPQDLQVYLVDGNLSATAYKDFEKDVMKGAIGTKPAGADVSAFNAELQKFDPSIKDVLYGAEAFDAANLIALGAVAAKCADGAAIAAAIPGIAGNGGEKVSDFATAAKLLAEGKDIDFEGQSGPLDFTANGDLASANITINEYTSNVDFKEIGSQAANVPTS